MPTRTYRYGRALLRRILPLWIRVDARGVERLPAEGPFILSANHRSVIDPLLLAALVPRPMTFLAAGYLFRIPVVGWVVRGAGVLPLGGPAASRRSLQRAEGVLRSGAPVALFPEGGVREDLGDRLERGAGFLALRTGVPIYPVRIDGTETVLPVGRYVPRRGAVRVRVANPLRVPPGAGSREVMEELSRVLQNMGEE